jgi:isocitrate dehydrogenase
MELITKSGQTIVLKPKVSLLEGEIIDSMFMSRKALLDFYEKQIEDAHETGVLFSLHVKAMMKVSHPIVFGHCVRMFYKEAFEKHGALLDSLGVNVNNGMADLHNKLAKLPDSQREEVIRDFHACQEHRPALAMVDSAKGITNFHSPNDVIVGLRVSRVIGDVVTLALQFLDGCQQLAHRGADVGQLDDVGVRFECLLAQFAERVGHALFRRQILGEVAQDPCRD